MTYTVIPDMVSFEAIFSEVARVLPYDGPPMPEGPSDYRDVKLSDVFCFDEPNPVGGSAFARYAAAQEVWQFRIRKVILNILEAKCAHVTLAMDDPSLPPKTIDAQALRHVPASRLAVSMFDPLDYRLKTLAAYHGARILVSKAAADAIRAALKTSSPTGGRPEHPARQWYAAQGFRRGGLRLKELQRRMGEATGSEPPSESAIRTWERDAKKNTQ